MKLHQKLDCSFWYSREEKFWFRERKRKNIQHQQKQQIILIRLFNLLLFQLVNSTIVLFLDSNPMKLSYFFELFCHKMKKDKRCLLSNIHNGIKIQKRKLEYTRERGGKSYSEDTSRLFFPYWILQSTIIIYLSLGSSVQNKWKMEMVCMVY